MKKLLIYNCISPVFQMSKNTFLCKLDTRSRVARAYSRYVANGEVNMLKHVFNSEIVGRTKQVPIVPT